MTKAVKSYRKTVKDVAGSHDINVLSQSVRPIDAITLEQEKNARKADVLDANCEYLNAYNGLDSAGKKAFDEIVAEAGDSYKLSDFLTALDAKREAMATEAAEAEQALSASSGSSSGGFSPLYFVLGFIVGVVVYVVLYYILFILARLVRTDNDLGAASSVKNFGGIYEYPYSGAISKLLHDKKVYARRVKDVAKTADRINDDIASKLGRENIGSFKLISLGKMSENAEKLANKQIKALSGRNINASIIKIEGPVTSVGDAELSGAENVIILMLGDITKWKDIGELCKRLAEYNVNIIGSEFIQA